MIEIIQIIKSVGSVFLQSFKTEHLIKVGGEYKKIKNYFFILRFYKSKATF
ncbi:MAG: hypothetical protein ACJA0X_003205 [Cyclobacteriaceae bacterium]|jgi:hypothetical protein